MLTSLFKESFSHLYEINKRPGSEHLKRVFRNRAFFTFPLMADSRNRPLPISQTKDNIGSATFTSNGEACSAGLHSIFTGCRYGGYQLLHQYFCSFRFSNIFLDPQCQNVLRASFSLFRSRLFMILPSHPRLRPRL